MTKDNIINATKYVGSDERMKELDEVLITGEIINSVPLLEFANEKSKNSKNANRLELQVEFLFMVRQINDKMLDVFTKFKVWVRTRTHINHPVEF